MRRTGAARRMPHAWQLRALAALLHVLITAHTTAEIIDVDPAPAARVLRRLQVLNNAGAARTTLRFGASFGPRDTQGSQGYDTFAGYKFWEESTNAATCTETATTSVTADADACAAVTALDDNVACAAVRTAADNSVAACTYDAGGISLGGQTYDVEFIHLDDGGNTAEGCTSTLADGTTTAFSDTTNCVLTPAVADDPATGADETAAGSCADVASAVATCAYHEGGQAEYNYEALIDDHDVDILLSTETDKTAIMSRVAEAKGTLNVACCTGPKGPYQQGHAWLFGMHVPSDYYSRDLLRTLSMKQTGRPVNKVAIAYRTDSGFTVDTCAAAARYAEEFGLEVVLNQAFTPATGGAGGAAMEQEDYTQLMRDVKAAGPDVFIGCTFTDDSIAMTRAAHDVKLVPKQLAAMFLTVGPTKEAFVSELGTARAEGVLTPAQWHHTMEYEDPYYTSSAELNSDWKEFSLSNGHDLDYVTASAIATGVTLRLALEAAAGSTSTSVRDALASDSCMSVTNTFFGTVRMSPAGHEQGDRRNIGHLPALLQIQNGVTHAVLPSEAAQRELQYYAEPEIDLQGCMCAHFVEARNAGGADGTELWQQYEPGAVATDMRGATLEISNRWIDEAGTDGDFDPSIVGEYKLEYSVQDQYGFVANTTRDVIVQDTIKPNVSLHTDFDGRGKVYANYPEKIYVQYRSGGFDDRLIGVAAQDNLDGDLKAKSLVFEDTPDFADTAVGVTFNQTLWAVDMNDRRSESVLRTIMVVCEPDACTDPDDCESDASCEWTTKKVVGWSAGGLLLLVVMYEVLEWRAKRIRRGHYTTFLSHHKQDAGEAASELRAHLNSELLGIHAHDCRGKLRRHLVCLPHAWKIRSRGKNFLDVDDLEDISQLVKEVKRTKVFVLLLTRAVLTRVACLIEIYTALITPEVDIVLVPITGKRFSFSGAEAFLKQMEEKVFDEDYMQSKFGASAWGERELAGLGEVPTATAAEISAMQPEEAARFLGTPDGQPLSVKLISAELSASLLNITGNDEFNPGGRKEKKDVEKLIITNKIKDSLSGIKSKSSVEKPSKLSRASTSADLTRIDSRMHSDAQTEQLRRRVQELEQENSHLRAAARSGGSATLESAASSLPQLLNVPRRGQAVVHVRKLVVGFVDWLAGADGQAEGAGRPLPTAAELRAELESLTLRQLKARAREAGAMQYSIDELEDAADPKIAAVDLVISHAQAGTHYDSRYLSRA